MQDWAICKQINCSQQTCSLRSHIDQTFIRHRLALIRHVWLISINQDKEPDKPSKMAKRLSTLTRKQTSKVLWLILSYLFGKKFFFKASQLTYPYTLLCEVWWPFEWVKIICDAIFMLGHIRGRSRSGGQCHIVSLLFFLSSKLRPWHCSGSSSTLSETCCLTFHLPQSSLSASTWPSMPTQEGRWRS